MTEEPADGLDPETYGTTELLDRPVDRVTPAFFRDIVSEYVEADRLDRGIARLTVDGDRERCFVVADGLAEVSDAAYAEAEIAEVIAVLESDGGLLEQPLELSVPVGDEERVIEEVTETGTVSVFLQPEGLVTILQNLLAALEDGSERGTGAGETE